MLNKLSNILTGRNRHWQVANKSYTDALWERSQNFPPAIASLLKNFTGASYFLVEELLGPEQGSKRLIKIDPLEITSDQFQSIHNLNIWSFVSLFCNLNPLHKDSIILACVTFIGLRENERQMAYDFDLMGVAEPTDIGQVCSRLHKELMNVLGIQNPGLLDWYLMTPTYSYVFKRALEIHKQDIASL